MPLSDTAIRSSKPSSKPQKLGDGAGLYLLLKPTGARWWRFDYRFGGKRKTLSFGVYPDVPASSWRASVAKRHASRLLLASTPGSSARLSRLRAPSVAPTASRS